MQHHDDEQVEPAPGSRAAAVATAMQQSCLGLRVGRLHRLVGRRFEQALRPLGLSVSQLEVLSALVLHAEAVKPTDLASWLAVERSTMSRNLAVLESRGYVVTTETSPTGRSQRVAVSAEGVQVLARAEQAWRHAQAAVLGSLGPDAVSTLDTWLAGLTTAADG